LVRPNGHTWGLAECNLTVQPATRVTPPPSSPGFSVVRDAFAFAGLMLRLVPELSVDLVATWLSHVIAVTRRRTASAAAGVAGQPLAAWPGTLWKLWHGRKVNRAR